ncbi:MAG: hypothetical protein R3B72_36005 [Polyangiaceae bacterium]
MKRRGADGRHARERVADEDDRRAWLHRVQLVQDAPKLHGQAVEVHAGEIGGVKGTAS